METDELTAFVEVARQRSFSLASESLFITQPAVSKRIAQLEDKLAAKLFDRIGRQVLLTEAGRTLLPQAESILQGLRIAQQSIRDLEGQIQGSLSLATSHHIGLHRLPAVLERYVQTYPQVSLHLEFLDSELACGAVERGDMEIGVVTLPENAWDNLECVKIWCDRLHIVLNPKHPLANRKRIKLEDLKDYNAVLPAQNTFTRRIVEAHFRERGLQIKENLTSNYLETIKMLVSVGLGWSILPETMVDDSIVSAQVSSHSFKRDLGVVYHKQRTLSNAAQQFLTLLKKHAHNSKNKI
ncbi:MAG: LysR family transcriptional regulator [Gammaproteobacteria bacterium]|nr:LysR family transcriptional regulator [Gammaproteobacteria bacterium]MDH5693007.1 LysR family transcriptional regulator [Gammaproteobacteria bacterium]